MSVISDLEQQLEQAVTESEIKAKELFIPIHWNDQFASNARVDSLVADIVDKVSGQPEFKFTPAKIKKLYI